MRLNWLQARLFQPEMLVVQVDWNQTAQTQLLLVQRCQNRMLL
jgi:hypothetical protein